MGFRLPETGWKRKQPADSNGFVSLKTDWFGLPVRIGNKLYLPAARVWDGQQYIVHTFQAVFVRLAAVGQQGCQSLLPGLTIICCRKQSKIVCFGKRVGVIAAQLAK